MIKTLKDINVAFPVVSFNFNANHLVSKNLVRFLVLRYYQAMKVSCYGDKNKSEENKEENG